MKYLALVIILTVTFVSCIPGRSKWHRIKVYNNSNDEIAFIAGYTYPDTSIPADKSELFGSITAHSWAPLDSIEEWDDIISKIPGKKISFFFFDWDTVNHYGWDTIRTQYKILIRKDFSFDELKASKYEVSFP